MSKVQVHLPDSLQKQLKALAEREGISPDQFIASAVAEKMASLLTESYLEERAKRGDRAKYEAALARVAEIEAEPNDRLPES
jgi:hypothetical protein